MKAQFIIRGKHFAYVNMTHVPKVGDYVSVGNETTTVREVEFVLKKGTDTGSVMNVIIRCSGDFAQAPRPVDPVSPSPEQLTEQQEAYREAWEAYFAGWLNAKGLIGPMELSPRWTRYGGEFQLQEEFRKWYQRKCLLTKE